MASTLELLLLANIAQLAVPVTVAPASTASAGTATSSVTGAEILDSVLGTYQCSLIQGRRYVAMMTGLTGNLSVAGDIYLCNIRNSGSSSAPTTASTLVAQQQWTTQSLGSAGRVGIPLANTFIAPSTGLNTFGYFTARSGGTGSFTPVSPLNGIRELYVMYLGAV